jgi:DNA adenine methylase
MYNVGVAMENRINIPTFVKWAGGKSQLIPQLSQMLPQKIDTYIEPFVGSGAMYFFIKQMYKPKHAFISDTNKELINAFKIVRDKPHELVEVLKKYKRRHSKDYFYKTRDTDPNTLSDLENAARFIYLNKTCFNGLYRVNSKGRFNVPIGSYKKPSIFDSKMLLEASRLLKGTVIKVASFQKAMDAAKAGDFIYFDPPYYPLSKTSSFTAYTKKAFLEDEQKELANTFKNLDKRGCVLMLSNSNSDFIKSLYSKYVIKDVLAKRFINSDSSKRGAIKEIVVTNYPKVN